jgi:hypothetical protein
MSRGYLLSDVKVGEKIIGTFSYCGKIAVTSGKPGYSGIEIIQLIFTEMRLICLPSHPSELNEVQNVSVFVKFNRYMNSLSPQNSFDEWKKVHMVKQKVDYSQSELSQEMLDTMRFPYPFNYSLISKVWIHSDVPQPQSLKTSLLLGAHNWAWEKYAALKEKYPVLNDDVFASFSIKTDTKMPASLMDFLIEGDTLHLNVPTNSAELLKELIKKTPLAQMLETS